MTLQANKDENSSRKLFLMLFHSSEYQVSCLSPGGSHMQVHHSVKLGWTWVSKPKSFLSVCSSCSTLSMLTAYGTEKISEPWSHFPQTSNVLSCHLTWIETKQAPQIHLYSDSVKHSFIILSQGLFWRVLTGYLNMGGWLNVIWEWGGRYTSLLEFWQALR